MREARPIALGLPVYNGENYLRQTLDSILSQTFSDFDLVISDNASTDLTAEICRDYAASDDRIRYVRQDRNIGAAANYDFVFHASENPYFKWCAHDDLLGPQFLETCIAELDSNPGAVGAIPADIRDIDAAGAIIRKHTIDLDPEGVGAGKRFEHYLMQGYIEPHCSPFFSLFRNDALKRSQLHGDYWASDRVLVCEMLLHGRIVSTAGSHFAFRRHAEQFSSNLQHGSEYWSAWLNPGSDLPIHLRDTPYIAALAKAILRSPAGFVEKQRAFLALMRFARIRRQGLINEFRWRLSVRVKSNAAGRFVWESAKKTFR